MATLIHKKLDGTDAQRWELGDVPLIVGRGEKAHARITDGEMSRQHFEIVPQAGAYLLRDMQSKNGTQVNGQRVTEIQLKFDDQIRAGESHFVFIAEADTGSMPTITGKHQPKMLKKE